MCIRDSEQTAQSAAVGEEVVDDEHMVVGPEKTGGDDDVVDAVVGEGLDARGIHRAIQVDGLGLLREHHGHAEMMRHHGGDADARGLDGEDLVNGLARKQALPFLGHLGEQLLSLIHI